MAVLINHADGIVRDAPSTPEFKEYPMLMAHPAYDPGSIGEEVTKGGFKYHVGGTPARLPPVTVTNKDDEEYYAAQGYVSKGKSDPQAFAAAHAAAIQLRNYTPQEYPKWAGGVLVNNAEEEQAALEARRAQLGMQESQDEVTAEVEKPADPAEVEALKATIDGLHDDLRKADEDRRKHEADMQAVKDQMAEMRAMMQSLMTGKAVQAATPAPVEEASQDATPRGRKGWETRQRKKAEQEAALAAQAGQEAA